MPKQWYDDRIHQNQNYKPLGNNPQQPTDRSRSNDIRTYRGKYYMPSRQYFDQGDNIELRPCTLPIGGGIKIRCYNLSLLGNKPSTATMLAHMYKGKPSSYLGKYSISTKGLPKNIKQYLKNMANLFDNCTELKSFSPDYIVYPQSSSEFNGIIAKSLRYVYPNAKIMDNKSIYKIKVWGIDYNSLIDFYIEDLPTKEYKSVYNKYSNNKVLQKDLLARTIYKSSRQLITNFICRKIIGITENDKKLNIKRQEEIFNQIESIFNEEYDKFSNAMQKHNLQIPIKNEMFRLILNMIFTNENYGKYNKDFSKRNARNNGGRESIFYSIDNFKKAFISDNPKVYLNYPKIKAIAQTNDTIKNYDAQQRFAITGQFGLSNNAENIINKDSKILIIDDNYATGVSLKNAALLFVQKGIEPQNIIAITPGDMGWATTGGKRGSDIPIFDAEGSLANTYSNGGLINTQLSASEKERLQTLYQKTKDNTGHKKRNKLINNGII